MAGRSKGVAAQITKFYPKALYTHCAAHRFNLSVVKCCTLKEVANMMSTYSRYNSSLLQQFVKAVAGFGVLDRVDLPR